jgi:ABC-type multidrug transport system fused ATPase/permease subunit
MWFAHILTAAGRGAYDTRLFTGIYAEIATHTVARQRAAGAGVTEVAARTAMAREVVDFFERGVPTMAATAVGLAGSAVMLFTYDLLVGLAAVGLLVPVYAANRAYGRRARRLSRGLNDRLEREVAVIAEGDREAAAAHFAAVARWRVRLSDAEVLNRALVELAALAAVVLVLARTAGLPGARPGEIYAILAYVWTMLERLDEVPLLVQQVARLADVRRRLEEGEAAGRPR